MGKRLDVMIPEDLEREFRIEIARQLGGKKGDLSAAVEEAIREWIKSRQKKRRT